MNSQQQMSHRKSTRVLRVLFIEFKLHKSVYVRAWSSFGALQQGMFCVLNVGVVPLSKRFTSKLRLTLLLHVN